MASPQITPGPSAALYPSPQSGTRGKFHPANSQRRILGFLTKHPPGTDATCETPGRRARPSPRGPQQRKRARKQELRDAPRGERAHHARRAGRRQERPRSLYRAGWAPQVGGKGAGPRSLAAAQVQVERTLSDGGRSAVTTAGTAGEGRQPGLHGSESGPLSSCSNCRPGGLPSPLTPRPQTHAHPGDRGSHQRGMRGVRGSPPSERPTPSRGAAGREGGDSSEKETPAGVRHSNIQSKKENGGKLF